MVMSDGDAGPGLEDLSDQVTRLRAERDEARAELERVQEARGSRHLTRRVVAGVLVVISCLSFLAGGVGIWASRSFLDTDVWVDRVGPLADNPDVQEALSARITSEIMQVVDPQTLFQEALPERGQILAVPLSGAVEGFVGDQVDNFVAGDAFADIWVGVNRQAHQAAVKVLRGESDAVTAGDETVTLNLVPVINRVLASITSASPELFGRSIDIPDVQIDEVPTKAIDAINNTFGTDLPDDFGQITVYDGGELEEIQDAVALFDRIVWISVVVFVLSTVGAFAASVNRRRTFYELAIPWILILLLLRRGAVRAQDQVLDLVPPKGSVPAVRATTDALLSGLFDGTRILVWILVVALAVVWVTGPTDRAGALRRRAASAAAAVAGAASERSNDPATATWLIAHRPVLQAAGVVVAVVLLLWLNLGWFGMLLLLVILGAYEWVLARLEGPGDDDAGQPVHKDIEQSPTGE
jgi:hypothetical protein